MRLKVAILRDEIVGSRPGETTHFFAREAQARGHAIWCFLPRDLRWEAPSVIARARSLRYHGAEMDLGPPEDLDLSTVDVVLVRHDPPADLAWLLPTWLLERLPPRVVVANPPRALRDTPDKLVLLELPDLAPPTLVTAEAARIRAFCEVHGEVVIKPLFDKAQAGVVMVARAQPDLEAVIARQLSAGLSVMAQRWQPEGELGVVRVMIVDGEVCGALRALPREGDRCVGLDRSRAVVAHVLDADQRATISAVAALLAARGIVFAGADLVGRWLIEVNVTSAGGEVYYDRVQAEPLAPRVWDALERRAATARGVTMSA